MCEINESPLFLKLNPLAKTNDVGHRTFCVFLFFHIHVIRYKNNPTVQKYKNMIYFKKIYFYYRKDSCISRTYLLKFWVKNRGCGLYTRPLI